MRSEIKKETIVTIELTPEEADWLKGIMQNPINVKSSQGENKKDKDMREALFSILPFQEDLK